MLLFVTYCYCVCFSERNVSSIIFNPYMLSVLCIHDVQCNCHVVNSYFLLKTFHFVRKKSKYINENDATPICRFADKKILHRWSAVWPLHGTPLFKIILIIFSSYQYYIIFLHGIIHFAARKNCPQMDTRIGGENLCLLPKH
jgi:hypothetical protein